MFRRKHGVRHGAHAGILPDVSLVKNLDGGCQGDSQQGADQAAGAAAGAQPDDGPSEADYEVVDDKEGK